MHSVVKTAVSKDFTLLIFAYFQFHFIQKTQTGIIFIILKRMNSTNVRIKQESRSMNKNRVILIVGIIAITLLLLAVAGGGHSPRFYTILRITVCVAAVLQAVKSFKCKNWILWGNCFIAILFNPLFIIHLTRNIWMPIDIGVAVFFCAAMYHSYKRSSSKERLDE